MTDDPLGRALREHYRAQAPQSTVMDRLRDATLAADRGGRLARPLALAAAALVALALGVLALRSGDAALAGRVAAEVSLNHAKGLTLDVRADSYRQIASAMDKLDFPLAAPAPERTGQLTLTGGRYCSIQGQIAAQLRLEGPEGRVATLYQTRLHRALADLGERTIDADGVTVTLWSANGVFHALARDATGAASAAGFEDGR